MRQLLYIEEGRAGLAIFCFCPSCWSKCSCEPTTDLLRDRRSQAADVSGEAWHRQPAGRISGR